MTDEDIQQELQEIKRQVSNKATNGMSLWGRILVAAIGAALIPAFGVAVSYGSLTEQVDKVERRATNNTKQVKKVTGKVTILSERVKGVESKVEIMSDKVEDLSRVRDSRHRELMDAIEEDHSNE